MRTPDVETNVDELQRSVARLRGIVQRLDDDQLATQAYPTEWTVADVLSHLGSGAVIMKRRIDDIVAGADTPDDFAPTTWEEWNAKGPSERAADGLKADESLLERVASLTDSDRAQFRFALGPMTFDLAGFVGLRLNEHALHTWDVEVAFDPSARVPDSAVELIIDNLQMIARFGGRPTGASDTITVQTTQPSRSFEIGLTPDSVSMKSTEGLAQPDVTIDAEAFVRLVYGRLDHGHTVGVLGEADRDELRRVFRGI